MKWLRILKSNTPTGHAVRFIRELEVRSGLASTLQPAHDYANDVEHPSAATFKRRIDLYGALPNVSSFFEQRPVASELVLAHAEMIRVGTVRWFDGLLEIDRPPDWHEVEGTVWERHHYSHVLKSPSGDFRTIWELGRAGFLVDLACAFAIDSDSRWSEEFVNLVRSFARDNLVNDGVHWTNGQEVAIRALNIFWAFRLFAPTLSDEDYAFVCDVLYWHGRYVHQHLEFATEVLKNNHALSESLLLCTFGLYFRDWPEASLWKEDGRSALENVREQFSDDGGYCQASDNYKRFALQLLLWGERFGIDISAYEDVFRLVLQQWCARIGADGWLTNFGQNDGAWFGPRTPETTRSYRDILNVLSFRDGGRRRFEADEYGAWLFGDEYESAEATLDLPDTVSFPATGWEILRLDRDNRIAIRTALPRENAGHDDFGHVDVLLRGQQVSLDSGSERYMRVDGEREPLMSAEHHCVVTCDGAGQREPWGRFSWLNAAFESEVIREEQALSLRHRAFDGWTHVRKISSDSAWVVEDALNPEVLDRFREFSIWWKLPYGEFERVEKKNQLTLKFETFSFEVTCEGSVEAVFVVDDSYVAPTYGERLPALRIEVRMNTRDGFTVRSTFS